MVNSTNFKIAIIDYEMGNLFSVKQACESIGLNAIVTSSKSELLDATAAILPGVGAFGDAMSNLHKLDLIYPIKDFINSARPFMGICLGMQLLMSESEEFGQYKGLDIIKGPVVRFSVNDGKAKIKIPQVGWNQIFKTHLNINQWDNSPLKNLDNGEFMYFVHSYYPLPSTADIVLSVTSYENIEYCSSIQYKNIFASQFHPEKSAKKGLEIYKNWALMIETSRKVLR